VILVHGCFWHQHSCGAATVPKSNTEFWERKFAANKARDKRVRRELSRLGWKALVVWEYQTYDLAKLERILRRFFNA